MAVSLRFLPAKVRVHSRDSVYGIVINAVARVYVSF